MRNKWIYKVVSLSLLAGILASCGSGSPDSTDGNTPDEKGEHQIEITVNRTPTPVLDPEDIPIQMIKPIPGPDPEQPGLPDTPVIKGAGEVLDGYTQLLQYIDRTSLSGPAGWGTHPLGDLFDGLFETTAEGSNKYGHNEGFPFEIQWKMVKSVSVSAYTIYTANDAETQVDRNPKAWELYGSDDGSEWTLLHTVEDAKLPVQNYTGKTFYMENTHAYRYYKCKMTESVGGGFQLAELLLYTAEDIPETPPVIPPIGVGEFEGTLPAQGLGTAGKEAEPLVGEDAVAWMREHELLNSKANFLSAYISVACWADKEGPAQLLDGDFDGDYSLESMENNSGGKLGCAMPNGAYFVCQTEQAIAPGAYVLVTGNDTATYSDRNPIQWVLYGSTDGENWVALDQVSNGNMVADDFLPHVYTIDNTESYHWFCISFENSGTMQLQELMFFQ